MIEATIEARLTAIIEAGLPTANVIGFYAIADEGTVKTVEPPFIAVKANPKSNPEPDCPAYDIDIELQVVTSRQSDERMAVINPQATFISEMFEAWQGTPSSAERIALKAALETVGGAYTVDGLTDNGGAAGFDRDTNCWFFYKNVTIHINLTEG